VEEQAANTVVFSDFSQYMDAILKSKHVDFNYDVLKKSSFNERKKIAFKFLDVFIHSDNKTEISPMIFFHRAWFLGERMKNFLYYIKQYLNEEMPEEISIENEDDEELQVDENFNWDRVTSLGRFHGELYSCSVITNAWLEIWIKNIFNLVRLKFYFENKCLINNF
jgi:hypothetical protein